MNLYCLRLQITFFLGFAECNGLLLHPCYEASGMMLQNMCSSYCVFVDAAVLQSIWNLQIQCFHFSGGLLDSTGYLQMVKL